MSKPFGFVGGGLIGAAIVWFAMVTFWLAPLRREHTRMRETLTDAAEQLTLDAIAADKDPALGVKAMHRNADLLRKAAMYQAPPGHIPESGK